MVQRVLTKLKVDYLDYYLVWSIMNKDQLWKIQRPGGMIEGLLKAKEQGLVRHIGVSVHCDPEDFREWALQAKYCELAVFPVNLVNSRYLQCLEKVHQMGTKTLVMNPLCGGKLPSEDERIVELLKKTSINSIPELSIRYLKTNKNIDGILLGIKSKEDIDSAFSHLAKPDLTEQDLNAIKEFQNSYSKVKLCTKCKYCLPCPNGIDIPEVLEFLRIYRDWKKEIPDDIKRWTEKSGIKNCSQCKACESSCPSKIKVSSLIQKFLDGTSFKSLK
jgi:predicted aldo/keto reductase-like oxidoreductase